MSHLQHRKSFALSHRSRGLAALVMACGLITAAPIQAEPQPGSQGSAPQAMSPEQRQRAQAFRQKRQELLQLQRKLDQIQEKVVKSHPELQKKQEAFGNLMMDEMKSNGHTPEKDLAELKQMRGKLRSQDTPASERQQLIVEFQEKFRAFKQAQRQAMQSDEVQTARTELMEDLRTAMREEHPETDKLLEQMEQTQQELMQIRQSATGGQAGGQ